MLFLFATIIGVILGIIPIIHPNNVIPLLNYLPLDKIDLSIMAISFLLGFSFSSIIPTALLGYPEKCFSFAPID